MKLRRARRRARAVADPRRAARRLQPLDGRKSRPSLLLGPDGNNISTCGSPITLNANATFQALNANGTGTLNLTGNITGDFGKSLLQKISVFGKGPTTTAIAQHTLDYYQVPRDASNNPKIFGTLVTMGELRHGRGVHHSMAAEAVGAKESGDTGYRA